MTITEIFLFDFDAEMSRTRKLLELVPDPKSEWKPHEKSMKMGYLACHTAELANWCLGTAQTSQVDIPATFKREIPETIPQLLARFDTSVAEARAAIATLTDADWGIPWTLKSAGRTVFSLPRHAVLRNVCLNHMIHHRAQLQVYLRLNGIAVPGMYGPSADETAANGPTQP